MDETIRFGTCGKCKRIYHENNLINFILDSERKGFICCPCLDSFLETTVALPSDKNIKGLPYK